MTRLISLVKGNQQDGDCNVNFNADYYKNQAQIETQTTKFVTHSVLAVMIIFLIIQVRYAYLWKIERPSASES